MPLAAQVEYFLDGAYLGAVFTGLPDLGPGRVWRWAVSKGWRGAAAYAYLGHCRVG